MFFQGLFRFNAIRCTLRCLMFSLIYMILGNDKMLAQITFNTNSALPFDLDNETNYANCASAGTKAFTFEVECVGVLNLTDKQLAEINVRLDASCGGNLTQISAWIKSPAGTCVQLFSTMGTTSNYNTVPVNRIDYTFRSGSTSLGAISLKF